MENVNTIPGTNMVASPGVMSAFAAFKASQDRNATLEQTVATVKQAAKEQVAKTKQPKEPKTNTKKQAAMRIFEANKDKGNGEIAKLISTELEITYANAYYYVTRVFVR